LARFDDGVIGVGIGDADLAGFLYDLERGFVEDPFLLVGEEVSEAHVFNG